VNLQSGEGTRLSERYPLRPINLSHPACRDYKHGCIIFGGHYRYHSSKLKSVPFAQANGIRKMGNSPGTSLTHPLTRMVLTSAVTGALNQRESRLCRSAVCACLRRCFRPALHRRLQRYSVNVNHLAGEPQSACFGV